VRLAYWPGLGGGTTSLEEIRPVLDAHGIELVVLDPRYGARSDWDLDSLADELAATGADAYAGHSWGGAVAACAAVREPPTALVLLEGGFISPSEFARFGAKPTLDERVAEIREGHARYRWPTKEAYLEYSRSESARWNDTIEADALEGMRYENGEVLPPFDADELEAIVRAYDQYDARGAAGRPARAVRRGAAGGRARGLAQRDSRPIPHSRASERDPSGRVGSRCHLGSRSRALRPHCRLAARRGF
jgi:pimeloyl-ACP methyl ester carboxylesterase